MTSKVDQTSAEDPPSLQMATATSLPAVSTGSTKVSKFASKSGFVIPKNKLSGSLVPIFRGTKKVTEGDIAGEESTKQGQRKTKWGPDLTQDAAVRRGRALAYQTRVDQIVKQLESRILDIDENLDSASATKQPGERSSVLAFESEKSKLLELEKQEAIGEILKLNVSYKAPPDYKPLLKEDRVSIPVKEYPGYNFIGLIFGPGGDNRKRLEKETGTRVQVYGVKAGTKDKGEIIPADGNDCQGSYEEIYVHITADTFEKIDAAVSVIELLVTSVSGNLSAASAALGSCQADKENALGRPNSSPHVAPLQVTNPSIFLDAVGASQNPKPVQLQYSSPWFPNSPLTVPANPSSGFIPLSNASAAMINPGHQMPNMIGPRPAQVTTLNPVTQNQPLILPRPHPSSQFSQNQVIMHHPGVGPPPGNLPLPFQPASPAPPVHSAPIPFPGSQSPRIGPTVLPSFPQTRPDGLRGPQPDCLLVASGASSNMTQVGAPTGPTALAPQPTVVSAAPMANTAAGSMLTSPNFPSGPAAPHASALPVNHPSPMPMFSSVPPTGPIQSAHGAQGPLIPHAPVHPSRVSMPIPSPLPSGSSVPPFQSSPGSFPGSAPNFTPIRPPASQPPTPHRPNFGDFTFQPQRPQTAQAMRSLAPQPTPFRPPIHDTQPITPILPRASMGSMVRPQDVSSLIPFSGNPATSLVPPRLPAFPPMGAPPVPLMGQRNLNPAQSPNLAGAFPPRPGNPIEVQRNFHGPMNRPLSQHFGHNSPSFSGMPGQSHGVQQIYDPFSPTSVSNVPQQHGGSSLVAKKQENDPEYEDLMASVGVK